MVPANCWGCIRKYCSFMNIPIIQMPVAETSTGHSFWFGKHEVKDLIVKFSISFEFVYYNSCFFSFKWMCLWGCW